MFEINQKLRILAIKQVPNLNISLRHDEGIMGMLSWIFTVHETLDRRVLIIFLCPTQGRRKV